MPVIGTPVAPSSLNTLQPIITTLYDIPVLSKMRACNIKQAVHGILQLQLYDTDHLEPLDLTGTSAASIDMRFMEASSPCGGFAFDASDATILDPGNGIVNCTIPPQIMANSGVYIVNVAVQDTAVPPNILFIDEIYLWVDKSLFTLPTTVNPALSGVYGLPTLHSIRNNFRDEPAINRLLDNYEVDVCDICEAAIRSVNEWNQSQPPINVIFNTTTFPYTMYLLEGILGYLFEIAGNYYRRNALKHAGAGVQVDDLNRLNEYMQASQLRLQNWRGWMFKKKVDYNMQEGFSTLTSGYPASQAIYAQGW